MSDNNNEKKSNTGLIIAFLIFVLLAILLWNFSDVTQTTTTETNNDLSPPSIIKEGTLPQPEPIENETPDLKSDVKADIETAVEETEENTQAASPSSYDLSMIENDGTSLPIRAIGDPDAPIHIMEYSSLTCSHCGHFHKDTLPALKEKYIDTGKVYMIFREFPLNKAAIEASQILRCMPEEKHYSFMTLLFETQKEWAFTDDPLGKLKQNAKLAGLSEEKIDSCLADKDLEKSITESLKIGGEKYAIRSTPSFVINGGERLISGGQKIEFFDKVINDLLP